jgi:hypothetical protein
VSLGQVAVATLLAGCNVDGQSDATAGNVEQRTRRQPRPVLVHVFRLCMWLRFAGMLFLLEPFVLHRRLDAAARPERADPAFGRMDRLGAHSSPRLWIPAVLVTIASAP